jgi:hypothetical protein
MLKMNDKPKYVRLVSPKGVAVYPRLNTPSTKFKEEGEYSVKLSIPVEDATPFLEQIKAIAREFYKEQCALLKKEKLKVHAFPWEEDGNKVTVKFSNVAKITSKAGQVWEVKIPLLDSKGTPITDLIGGGSVLKVATEVKPWYVPALGVGVSLRLKAVQVIDLKAPSQLVSAEQFGFSTDEEGFVSGGETFSDSLFGSEQPSEPSEPTTTATSGEEF